MNLTAYTRPLALGAATAVLLGLGIAAALPAAADTGTLTIAPATGTRTTPITVSTSQACTGGTNLQVTVDGNGLSNINVTQNYALGALPDNAAGGKDIPLQYVMDTFANQQSPAATLSGKYTFTTVCKNAFGATVFDTFTGAIWFTDTTNYTATDPSTPSTTSTSTTLSVSPSSPQTVGTSVTLTAAVSPAAAGTVQFLDGTTPLGSPVTVTSGTAALATTALAVGSHSLTAVFTPTDATAYKASTSAAASFTVNAASATATATTTSLAASAPSAAPGDSVTFTASVTPADAAGTVAFTDGATVLGTIAVASGTASVSTTDLAVGSHTVVATFTPTDATAYAASSSSAVAVDVSSPSAVTGTQSITTSVPAGSLALTQGGTTVALPALALDASGSYLATSGAINAVTVVDTRAATPGYSVTGQVSDFAGSTGSINGYNLGWTPSVVSSIGTTAAAGPAVTAGKGLAASATPSDAAVGLKSSRTLGTGTGLGTSVFSAGLALTAPTSTVSGAYTATLTITAI